MNYYNPDVDVILHMRQFVFYIHCPPKVWKRPRQYWQESFFICDDFALIRDNTNYENIFYYINTGHWIHGNSLENGPTSQLSDLNCVLIGSLYSKLNWQSVVEAIKVSWPKNLLKTWAKFKPVTRHHSMQRGMSDFDMYILPLLCNQNENYYCWSSVIMSRYLNVFAPKNEKDLCWYCPKPHFSRASPNFWRAVYVLHK